MDMITGKGPSNRHEIWYFGESELGAVRIDDYKYRFIDQPGGWLGDKTKADVPYLTNLRLDPFERTGWPDSGTKVRRAAILRRGSNTNSGASCSSNSEVEKLAMTGGRVPAHAKGRELQPRCREGENRGGSERQWPVGLHDQQHRTARQAGRPPKTAVTSRSWQRKEPTMSTDCSSSCSRGRRILLSSLAMLPILSAALRSTPAVAQAQSDPLPSWNDGATKASIRDFVARVTTQGGPLFRTGRSAHRDLRQ